MLRFGVRQATSYALERQYRPAGLHGNVQFGVAGIPLCVSGGGHEGGVDGLCGGSGTSPKPQSAS